MKRILFFILIFILIIALCTVGYFIPSEKQEQLSGELATLSTNPNAYAKTIAICNSTNFCQDYRITCQNGQLIEKYPIENATIQHSMQWTDNRDIDYNNLCK